MTNELFKWKNYHDIRMIFEIHNENIDISVKLYKTNRNKIYKQNVSNIKLTQSPPVKSKTWNISLYLWTPSFTYQILTKMLYRSKNKPYTVNPQFLHFRYSTRFYTFVNFSINKKEKSLIERWIYVWMTRWIKCNKNLIDRTNSLFNKKLTVRRRLCKLL